ncbi:putative Glutathione S-transferase tau 7 [Hibiscus syriacus]|uniref:glutathione transferase n=1 Tax=Hibiscus syriacus TaxID=106335 RepID=A0A6A2YNV7_HIBSY|nr:glutathione S-transferase U7-like [Hibiscus syriacus]KAE8681009.1 putative Glutathione S-transferase tau 7 [Hibiscus syriacus]
MADEVKLFGMWASPYSRRVELALKLKGITYDYIEEDLSNKSSLLLKYNPVHQKIPVLVHNGKSISESLVILEYIDETWRNNPVLLPRDPYERSMARFWAKFIDEKILITTRKISFTTGKEQEQAMEELSEQLKLLENELKGKPYFAGEAIGYLDIVVANFLVFWFRNLQEALGINMFTKERFPIIFEWIEKVTTMDVVEVCRIPKERHLVYIRTRLEAIKSASR